MKSRMCTCSVHCPRSPYHESACCTRDCDCWCHEAERKAPANIAEILRAFAREMAEEEDEDEDTAPNH